MLNICGVCVGVCLLCVYVAFVVFLRVVCVFGVCCVCGVCVCCVFLCCVFL